MSPTARSSGSAREQPDTVSTNRDLLQRLPKAELHCHLDGSIRASTLLELGGEYGVALPRRDEAALRRYMRVPNSSTLEQYLERFEITLAVMQTSEALERIAYELAELDCWW